MNNYDNPHCLTCGSEKVNPKMIIYILCPGTIIPSATMYHLCDDHKNVRYEYKDIYDEKGNRKEIDHQLVINRRNKLSMEAKK